jgi:hypothetical protein
MFAMKVVDPKDAKLKASLEAEGNSMNGLRLSKLQGR